MSDLKVGFKVKMLHGYFHNYTGQILTLVKLENDSVHLFEDNNARYYIPRAYYKVVSEPEPTQHPHADLVLKYAMIAQYDDKPWEQFECDVGYNSWCPMVSLLPFHPDFQYRLKPQSPVVQVGQTWVSSGNNTEVIVLCSDYKSPDYRFNKVRSVKLSVVLDESIHLKTTLIMGYSKFISNFKRKE